MSGVDVYQAVTDRILKMLEEGTVPWRHPIREGHGQGDAWPRNLVSGFWYRGINVFLLAVTAWTKGYGSALWLTYKQAAARGGGVRKGEKSSMVVFWKKHETTDRETGEIKAVPVLRYYNVFNAEQCEEVKLPDVPTEPAPPFEPMEAAERIVAGYSPEAGDGPVIAYFGTRACYQPAHDRVCLPQAGRFVSREAFYSTAFHELAHSTGHSQRLDRGLDKAPVAFGSPDYSKEELVAEMGAAFLCAAAGISPSTIEQSAAYIAGWRRSLSEDRRLVVTAASAGQRAADWVLGVRGTEIG